MFKRLLSISPMKNRVGRLGNKASPLSESLKDSSSSNDLKSDESVIVLDRLLPGIELLIYGPFINI